MADVFQVGSANAVIIGASPTDQRKITNAGPGKLYYKTASDVDTEDTEVGVDSSVTTEETIWIISASESRVHQERLAAPTNQDLTVTDDLTVSGDIKGAPLFSEGVESTGTFPGVYTWQPSTAESGTDTKGVEKKLFVVSAFLPVNKTLTGVAILVGATGGKGKVVAGLFNHSGEVLAKSSETTEGTALGTAKEIQKLAFTSTYAAIGPRTYYIGITHNGVEEGTFRTIPANVASNNIWTAEKELAEKNKLANFSSPPTTFTADKGPVAILY